MRSNLLHVAKMRVFGKSLFIFKFSYLKDLFDEREDNREDNRDELVNKELLTEKRGSRF